MNSSNSPIIENNNNRAVSYLLFFLFVIGFWYFYLNEKNDVISVAKPVESASPMEKPIDENEKYFHDNKMATINANKMNVFYIGVENPVEIKMQGISSGDVKVSISGGGASIRKVGGGQYMVLVSTPTSNCEVTVSAGDLTYTEIYRVKRIPQPIIRLGNKEDGTIEARVFRAEKRLAAWLDNFDFDIKCEITDFNLARISKDGTVNTIANLGGEFTEDAAQLINLAKPDDIYQFTEVKCTCPGDPASRRANSLVFTIR